jgi:uncharacterized delta-60 repeat protein
VLLALTLVGCDFQVGTKTGELDPGFGGGDGFVTFAGRARSDDDADVAARQPDGKVVVLAHQEGRNLLVRQLPDGSLDPSFGDGGVAAVDLPFGLVRQMAIAPDGDILLVGAIFGAASFTGWLVARYDADGTPDTGFGTDGIAQFDLEAVLPVGIVNGVAPVGDDLVVLASRTGISGIDDGLVLKIGPDGTLDPAFGPNGDGTVRVGDAADTGVIVALPDGTFAVTTEQGTAVGLRKVGADGTPGAAIDLTGAAAVPFRFDASAVDDDGSLYVTGPDGLGQPNEQIVVKVTAGFTLDNGYGAGGVAVLEGPFFGSGARTQATLTDAGLVVTSRRLELDPGEHLLSARVTAAGTLDPTWGDGGIATYPDDARAVGLFTRPGGGVAVVGSTFPEGGEPADLLQLRTDATGAPDAGFGGDGRVHTDLGRAGLDELTVVAPLADGDLLVAGDTGDGVVAGRYDGSGAPDGDRPPAPLLPDRLVGPHVVRDATVAGDGSTYLLVQEGSEVLLDQVGGGGTGWDVVKLDADGAVDTTFGDDGVAHHTGTSFPHAIALQPDGTVLVAYTIVHPPQIIRPHQVLPATFDLAVKALTPAGTPDTAFGTGTTAEIVLPDSVPFDFAQLTGWMDVGDAGNAYLAGGSVLRLDPDGTAFTPLALPAGVTLAAGDLVVTGDDDIVVTGRGSPRTSTPPADVVARFGADGQLDTGFSGDGMAPLPTVAAGLVRTGPLLVVDGTGFTVVSQQRADGLPYDDLVVRRLHADGTVDATFSGDGLALGRLALGGVDAGTLGATVAGGDVVVVGRRDGDAVTTRING